jgi:hypothetical protein
VEKSQELQPLKKIIELGVVEHACNWEAETEAGGLQVPGQPGLHSKALPKKTKNPKNFKKEITDVV